ncbi:MAG: type II toxin-antitoxin system HicB family antitoxin [Candidatus Omnitrophica bacterium]|nr:type II toxin-antitoxin system HicB family antitoxin [Candidatus Omnitrophota bacterium]
MRKNQFLVLIEKDEDGALIATVPALKSCHTQARSLPVLLKRVKEVISLCLEVERPKLQHLDFVGIQEIEVGK